MRGLAAKGVLEIEDAPPGTNAYPELLRVERLRQIVVRARFHALHQILRFGARRQQHDVYIRFTPGGAYPAADLHAIHARHHPVQHRQPRCVIGFQDLPRFVAVVRHHGLNAARAVRGFGERRRDPAPGVDDELVVRVEELLTERVERGFRARLLILDEEAESDDLGGVVACRHDSPPIVRRPSRSRPTSSPPASGAGRTDSHRDKSGRNTA